MIFSLLPSYIIASLKIISFDIKFLPSVCNSKILIFCFWVSFRFLSICSNLLSEISHDVIIWKLSLFEITKRCSWKTADYLLTHHVGHELGAIHGGNPARSHGVDGRPSGTLKGGTCRCYHRAMHKSSVFSLLPAEQPEQLIVILGLCSKCPIMKIVIRCHE